MKEAKAIREKEAAVFAAFKSEADTNIGAVNKAVKALEKGATGAFLQTSTADVLRRVIQRSGDLLDDMDRQDVMAFLSSSQEYAPQSGQITGILKQLSETMAKTLADTTETEETAIKNFQDLVSAKTKEVAALTSAVESKTKQIGELGVQIVQMKEDLSDTQEALLADQKYLAELEKGCETKTAEWEERQKTRADELVALADTIRVLNDDDALDLFKGTLHRDQSFLQVSSGTQRATALKHINNALRVATPNNRAGLDFLVLALSGKRTAGKGGFEKVVKMVEEMVDTLKREQTDDDQKKEYCAAQFDFSDDKRKAQERSLAQEENAIATAKESLSTLTAEIAALEKSIKDLDQSVLEAGKQRQAENAEYKELMASDSAAKELLVWAKNRLNKFYNPALYKAPPPQELSREDQIAVNLGADAPTTPAPGGIADTGIGAFLQLKSKDAPAPPPETWGAYQKKGQESNGVLAMIDLLANDLTKELTEAETEEKNSQADYEKMMGDAASKRAADAKSLTASTSAKADVEGDLQSHQESKTAVSKELMATQKYIASLHSECDWLVKFYDMRKEARDGEIDSLHRAKAVLNGADYAFVQLHRSGLRIRHS